MAASPELFSQAASGGNKGLDMLMEGEKLMDMANYEEALLVLNKALPLLKTKANRLKVFENIAFAHYMLGDKENTEKYVNMALQLNPAFEPGNPDRTYPRRFLEIFQAIAAEEYGYLQKPAEARSNKNKFSANGRSISENDSPNKSMERKIKKIDEEISSLKSKSRRVVPWLLISGILGVFLGIDMALGKKDYNGNWRTGILGMSFVLWVPAFVVTSITTGVLTDMDTRYHKRIEELETIKKYSFGAFFDPKKKAVGLSFSMVVE